MNDETFLAFVQNNAPSCDVETLRKAVDKINAHIASRVFGRPSGIEIGSHVEASAFDGSFRRYGTVIKLTDRGCVIEPPSSRYTDRISFKKHIVRILDEFEWNRACFTEELFRKRLDEQTARESAEFEQARQQAIENQWNAERVVMESLNGPVQIFPGAFIHAFRPDWGTHTYGVVVGITPKKIDISSPDSILGIERITVAKHEITVLSDRQRETVDAELRRRADEWNRAKEHGTTDRLPDYCRFEIDLS